MEPISAQLKHHFKDKYRHVLKFYTFLYKNDDAPYHVKQTVWNSAVVSSIFYSSETWLTNDLSAAESVYLATLKRLLGVRTTTNNEIVLLEAGVPSAKDFIRHKQHAFVHKLLERDSFWDSYIGKAVSLSLHHKTDAGKVLKVLIDRSPSYDYAASSLQNIKQKVQRSVRTRHTTYRELNPSFSLNFVYTPESRVPEYLRISFTRMRLMSHRLRIETGRWTRPITLRENRLCRCKCDVQSEEHAMLRCDLTRHLRSPITSQCVNICELFKLSADNSFPVTKLCHDTLRFFDKPST